MIKILQDLATNNQSPLCTLATVPSGHIELLALCGRDHVLPHFKAIVFTAPSLWNILLFPPNAGPPCGS